MTRPRFDRILSIARRIEGGAAPAPVDDELVSMIEGFAAVSGAVDPAALTAHLPEHARRPVLRRLQSEFSVTREERAVSWTLVPRRRLQVLRDARSSGRLDRLLDAVTLETDGFGLMLRRMLREGAALPLAELGREELLALSRALEATEGLPISRPDRGAVTQRLEVLEQDQNVLLEHGLIGRDAELEALLAFVAAPPGGRRFDGLMVSGLGGSGKSTLLAAFQGRLTTDASATVVLLDFDRAGVDAGDSYWLELEMSRQVGRQHPESRDALRRARAEAREEQAFEQEGFDGYRGESALQNRRSVIESVRAAFASSSRPLVLLLDTFEEVAQGQNEGRVFSWLSSVSERLWDVPLKVVVSGRLMSMDSAERALGGPPIMVELGELTPEDAEKLLRAQHIPAEAAYRLSNSDVLPRRPLELKLLARLMAGRAPEEIEQLEMELRAGGHAAAELFAAVVYRRVLLRIKDPTTRALAHPGLVLRYVTPELISEVLVPALGLPLLETPAAAFHDLVRYEWLVARGAEPDRVWHRRDLRRSMLSAMVGKERVLAARVHASAAEYFRSRPSREEQLEGLYHEAMAVTDPASAARFTLEQMTELARHVATDVADLPPPAAALMRFAVGSSLGANEVALLPPTYRQSAYERVGEAAVRAGEWGNALRLFASEVRPPGPIQVDWERDTLFATAQWRAIAPDRRAFSAPKRLDELNRLLLVPSIVDRRWLGDREDISGFVSMLDPRAADTAGELDWSRFVTASTLLDEGAGLLPHAVARVRELRGRGRPSPSRWLAARIARPSAGASDEVELWTPLLPVDEAGLERFATVLAEVLDPAAAERLSQRLDALRDARSQAGGRARALLTVFSSRDFDVARLVGGATIASLPPAIRRLLLRGTDAELRTPARFALLAGLRGARGAATLGQLFGDLLPLELTELSSGRFTEAIERDPEHALEPYVELADRCSVLGQLLEAALVAADEREKLELVLRAQRRLRAAADACADALGAAPGAVPPPASVPVQ